MYVRNEFFIVVSLKFCPKSEKTYVNF